MTILATERLMLRHLTMGDAEALHHIHHEPGVWTHFQGTPPASVDDERAKIEEQLTHYREHGFGGWATVWRETGEFIGRCGLRANIIDGRAETELGYLISPRFRGRGLAKEAARGIRDYAFASLDCARLVALIHPDNAASKRVATAAGLRYERQTLFKEIEVELFVVERSGRTSPRALNP